MINARAIIFANGEIKDYNFISSHLLKDDLIICCDGGLNHVAKLSITPHFIIGDMDSALSQNLELYKDKAQVIKYPTEKDYTDLEICIRFAIDKNVTQIIIFGATGKRFDHALMNVQLLLLPLERNIKAYVIDELSIIQIMKDKIKINGQIGDLVSLIPLTPVVSKVTTTNLYYELNNFDLLLGSSRGISNVLMQKEATIEIKSGYLFVILTSKNHKTLL